MIGLLIMWAAAVGTMMAAVFLYNKNKNKLQRNNTKMHQLYKNIPSKMSSVNPNIDKFKYRIRDYYIASSYNSCCGGEFFFDYVDYEPLKEVIKQGARCLDLAIYLVDDRAVVAAGKNSSVDIKGVFNSLPCTNVFQTISEYALKGTSTCPNPKDPLFLHLRIKSNKPEIFDMIADALDANFPNLLSRTDKKYSYQAHGENLGSCPISAFVGSVVIMIDNSSANYHGTRLEELINFSSSTPFFKQLRNYEVVWGQDMEALMTYTKKNMVITMPDYSSGNANVPAKLHQKFGCQFVCMNYQNMDEHLRYYLDFFKESAFVLKPKYMRYIRTYIPIPDQADPAFSFAPRAIIMPQFQGWM